MSEAPELVATDIGPVPRPLGMFCERDPWLVLFDHDGVAVGTIAFAHDESITGVSRGVAEQFWNTNAHHVRNHAPVKGFRVEQVSERERAR